MSEFKRYVSDRVVERVSEISCSRCAEQHTLIKNKISQLRFENINASDLDNIITTLPTRDEDLVQLALQKLESEGLGLNEKQDMSFAEAILLANRLFIRKKDQEFLEPILEPCESLTEMIQTAAELLQRPIVVTLMSNDLKKKGLAGYAYTQTPSNLEVAVPVYIAITGRDTFTTITVPLLSSEDKRYVEYEDDRGIVHRHLARELLSQGDY